MAAGLSKTCFLTLYLSQRPAGFQTFSSCLSSFRISHPTIPGLRRKMTPYIASWPVEASLFCSSSEFSQSCLFSSPLQPLLATLGSGSIFLPGTYLSSSISHFHRRETDNKTALQTEAEDSWAGILPGVGSARGRRHSWVAAGRESRVISDLIALKTGYLTSKGLLVLAVGSGNQSLSPEHSENL